MLDHKLDSTEACESNSNLVEAKSHPLEPHESQADSHSHKQQLPHEHPNHNLSQWSSSRMKHLENMLRMTLK